MTDRSPDDVCKELGATSVRKMELLGPALAARGVTPAIVNARLEEIRRAGGIWGVRYETRELGVNAREYEMLRLAKEQLAKKDSPSKGGPT